MDEEEKATSKIIVSFFVISKNFSGNTEPVRFRQEISLYEALGLIRLEIERIYHLEQNRNLYDIARQNIGSDANNGFNHALATIVYLSFEAKRAK